MKFDEEVLQAVEKNGFSCLAISGRVVRDNSFGQKFENNGSPGSPDQVPSPPDDIRDTNRVVKALEVIIGQLPSAARALRILLVTTIRTEYPRQADSPADLVEQFTSPRIQNWLASTWKHQDRKNTMHEALNDMCLEDQSSAVESECILLACGLTSQSFGSTKDAYESVLEHGGSWLGLVYICSVNPTTAKAAIAHIQNERVGIHTDKLVLSDIAQYHHDLTQNESSSVPNDAIEPDKWKKEIDKVIATMSPKELKNMPFLNVNYSLDRGPRCDAVVTPFEKYVMTRWEEKGILHERSIRLLARIRLNGLDTLNLLPSVQYRVEEPPKKRPKIETEPLKEVVEFLFCRNVLNPWDRLSGRGDATNGFVGTQTYLDLCDLWYKLFYVHAGDHEKRAVAKAMIKFIENNGGRFLRVQGSDKVVHKNDEIIHKDDYSIVIKLPSNKKLVKAVMQALSDAKVECRELRRCKQRGPRQFVREKVKCLLEAIKEGRADEPFRSLQAMQVDYDIERRLQDIDEWYEEDSLQVLLEAKQAKKAASKANAAGQAAPEAKKAASKAKKAASKAKRAASKANAAGQAPEAKKAASKAKKAASKANAAGQAPEAKKAASKANAAHEAEPAALEANAAGESSEAADDAALTELLESFANLPQFGAEPAALEANAAGEPSEAAGDAAWTEWLDPFVNWPPFDP